MAIDAVTGETVELLAQLIRNRCVNDGVTGSEGVSATTLAQLLDVPGVELESFEPFPGRATLVARLPGRDPAARSLAFVTHTDVVPAGPEGWERDPFGGELADGFVWGRGAIDMLNLTSSMAIAFRRLALEGFRPRGSLVFVAAADEEAGGHKGASWLLDNHPELAMADYVVSETGGPAIPAPNGPLLPVAVLEKGMAWCSVTLAGTPGHGSRPYRSDNAVVHAAEAIGRLARLSPRPVVVEPWRRFVHESGLGADLADVEKVDGAIAGIADARAARRAHACTHDTFSPNVVRGGEKTNVIPGGAEIEVDIRTMPGTDRAAVRALVLDTLGPLGEGAAINFLQDQQATESPAQGPLWDALERLSSGLRGGARLVPTVMTGCTDARFWRERGATAYGFALFSESLSIDEHESMFHGRNERVDLESLRLSAELWSELPRALLT